MANKNSKAFVLMPFSDNYKEIYDEVYKKACTDNGFDCWRVDEISIPGSITNDIVIGILDSDVVIADLSSKNPNVFYELGISHTLGKNTIMTAQNKDDVPFDIANYRVIFYQQTIAGSKLLYAALNKALKELKKIITETSNPVQKVLSERTIFGTKQKIPILKEIDIGKLSTSMRKMFEDEKIYYVDDLKKINFDEVKEKYHFGAISMSYLMKIIISTNAYDNYETIHDYITTNRITMSPYRDDYLISKT